MWILGLDVGPAMFPLPSTLGRGLHCLGLPCGLELFSQSVGAWLSSLSWGQVCLLFSVFKA